MHERSVRPGSSRVVGRLPLPIVLVLLVLLPLGPVGWLWGRAHANAAPRPASTLAQIAARAGCRLSLNCERSTDWHADNVCERRRS